MKIFRHINSSYFADAIDGVKERQACRRVAFGDAYTPRSLRCEALRRALTPTAMSLTHRR